MYERFSDRARKVIQLSNQEAMRFNHEYIGTEHLLLGLVKEGGGIGSIVLRNLGIDLRKIRLEVEKRIQSGPDMATVGKLPQTPRTKKVIELAIEAARELGHNYVGTEHLLLGLVREKEGTAYNVLRDLGVTDQIMNDVKNLLGVVVKMPSNVREKMSRLQEEKERAVTDQDFAKAIDIMNEMNAIKSQYEVSIAKNKEDTETHSSDKLKRIACALFLHYKGDWTAQRAMDEIRDIVSEL